MKNVKKMILLMGLAAFLALAGVGSALADGDTATVSTHVSVTPRFDLTFQIRQMLNGSTVNYNASGLNFGELTSSGLYQPKRAATYFNVVMYPNTSGRPYRITQSVTAPSNGTVSLPAGACIMTPWSVNVNGQPLPSGSVVAARGTFIGTNLQLYNDPQGRSTSFVTSYAVTNQPSEGAYQYIPYDQAGGSYSTQAVFSLELL